MDMIMSLFSWVAETFSSAIYSILSTILPASPFRAYMELSSLYPYLGYINYFLPIAQFIAILEAWCAAVVLWYFGQLVIDVLKHLAGEVTPM